MGYLSMKFAKTLALAAAMSTFMGGAALAETIEITLTVKEVDLPIDNKGTMMPMWTYEGQVPGPVVRATEGDTIEFTLINPATNKNSHSMDFHAARVDVLDEFGSIKPGESKKFSFTADYPGTFLYHCGTNPMIQHVARGMFGAILIDPKDKDSMPKADREFVLVQSEIYENGEDVKSMMNNDWKHVVFNGRAFRYDPVHDPEATATLEAKPGERVRVHFLNAGPNEFASFHPIAGIWDKVYPGGNPNNAMDGMQSFVVGPGDAASFDIISPKEGANAFVNHSLKQALTGAIAVMLYSEDVSDEVGRGDNLVVR